MTSSLSVMITCRSHAISCVNQFIFSQSTVLVSHIGAYLQVCISSLILTLPPLSPLSLSLQNLFQVATDEDLEVRKHVCRALVMLLEVRAVDLLPHMPYIIEVNPIIIIIHSSFIYPFIHPSIVHLVYARPYKRFQRISCHRSV